VSDPIWKSSMGFASNSSTPSWILVELAKDSSELIRRIVSFNPNTPIEVLEILAQDTSPFVRSGVAVNGRMPLNLLKKLSQDEEEIRIDMAKEPTCPPAILQNFLTDNANVRASLARNPSLTADQFLQLFNDDDFANYSGSAVRGQLARNSSTPVHMLEALAADNTLDRYVANDLASNPSCPEHLLREFANTDGPVIKLSRVRGAVGNVACPKDLLAALSTHRFKEIRDSVAFNPSTPSEILKNLATDVETRVRVSVALNDNSPTSILEQLSRDRHKDVRWGVAKNKMTPPETLVRLSKSKHLTSAVASNPSTPQETIMRLLASKDAEVREAILSNHDIDSMVIADLVLLD
jgi:pentose-5-phosphate-3-epimerase